MDTLKIKIVEKETSELLDRINNVWRQHRDKITYGCKETAALKRKSMDLSRALTEMRRA